MQIVCARTGKVLERYEDRNLIVNGGRTAVMRLLGGDVAGRSITQIAFGASAAAPSPTDTAITSAFTKNTGAVTYPNISSVRFAWTLADNEANGLAIREYGLITANNTLFARKTREVVNKTSSISLLGSWTIQF